MSTSSRKVGVATPQLQPYSFGRRPDGRYTVLPYESTSQTEIEQMALTAESYGLQYDVTSSFGKWRIEIHYNYNWAGGTGDPATEMIEKWESVPLKTEKSILTGINPLTLKVINAGNGFQLDLIRRFIEGNSLEDLTEIDSLGNVSFTPPASVTDDNAIKILRYYFEGQRTIPFTVPSLKHTRVVNSSFISPATVPDVATLYSTPGLISNFYIPSGILVQLPANDTALIQPLVSPSGGLGNLKLTFGYAWLRSAPEVSQINNFKWSLSETFEYGLWGLDLFSGRIPDVTL